jgi:MHS family proline/betaine transporter-like MFS transporter
MNEVRLGMAIFFITLFLFFGRKLNRENDYARLRTALMGTAILIFPLHYAMINYGLYGYIISMAILTVINVIYLLPIAGLLSGLFDRRYRYTGVSLSINIVSSLFGGTTPLILIFLVRYFNSFFASGIYLFITAVIGFLTINRLSREPIKD